MSSLQAVCPSIANRIWIIRVSGNLISPPTWESSNPNHQHGRKCNCWCSTSTSLLVPAIQSPSSSRGWCTSKGRRHAEESIQLWTKSIIAFNFSSWLSSHVSIQNLLFVGELVILRASFSLFRDFPWICHPSKDTFETYSDQSNVEESEVLIH